MARSQARLPEGHGTHDDLVGRGGEYAALWREEERAKGWRLGRAAPAEPASRA